MNTSAYWEASVRQVNLPNGITLSRALLGLALLPFWWQLSLAPEWFLCAVLYAMLSDWLDGHLARHSDEVTSLGAVFDPLADKLFTNPALLIIAAETGSVWLWCLVVVNLLYDIDGTYARRLDIKNARLGETVQQSRPVTKLFKRKILLRNN